MNLSIHQPFLFLFLDGISPLFTVFIINPVSVYHFMNNFLFSAITQSHIIQQKRPLISLLLNNF